MHGALIVDLEVDVQNGVQILVVDRLFACLIVRLCLLAVDLSQALSLTLEFDARRDDRLRVLLPNGVIKRRSLRLRRLDLRRCRHIPHKQCQAALLGTQFLQLRIGRMSRENLFDAHGSDIAGLFRSFMPRHEEEHSKEEQKASAAREDLPAPRFPKLRHAPPSLYLLL